MIDECERLPRRQSLQAFNERYRNLVTGLLVDRFQEGSLDRQFVITVPERHKGALERDAIDAGANLHQSFRSEKLGRMRPHHIGPAARRHAFPDLRLEGLVECLSHVSSPD